MFPETRESLLVRVKSLSDQEAWFEFAALYHPVVYRLARQRGLQHADAEDLVQRVFAAVSRAIPDWQRDSSRGSFRSWLGQIARNAITNSLTRRPPDSAVGGTSVIERLHQQPQPEDAPLQELTNECRRSLFRLAAERIRDEFREATWQAFWLTAVEGMSVEDAATALSKSPGAVYAARSRIMRRLRTEIQQLDIDFQ